MWIIYHNIVLRTIKLIEIPDFDDSYKLYVLVNAWSADLRTHYAGRHAVNNYWLGIVSLFAFGVHTIYIIHNTVYRHKKCNYK